MGVLMNRKSVIPLSDLGDFIKKRRLELPGSTAAGHMTQKELGERLQEFGIKSRADTTIAGYEAGSNVPLTVIPALAQALEVSPIRLYALAGALNNVPAADLLLWVEREGLTQEQIMDAIQLLKVAFKK
jgi:hypothetical protein